MTETIVTHSTENFTWVPGNREFIAECSDFSTRRPWTIITEGNSLTPYVYLQNPKTGNKVLFVFLSTRESDGPDYEITAWVFGATPEECEKNPALYGLTVHFLND